MFFNENFKDRLARQRQAKADELRKLNAQRDQLATAFAEEWRPLISYVERLGRRHLPPGVRLTAKMTVDNALDARLSFKLEKFERITFAALEHQIWSPLSEIVFFNKSAKNFEEPGRLAKFFNKTISPDMSLRGVTTNRDKPLDTITLKPDEMYNAQEAIADWLATYISFDFDYDRLHPETESAVRITRTGAYSGPQNTP